MTESPGRVFVVGSLHLDVVVRSPRLPALDETLVGSEVRYECGGKGANQATAVAQHDAPVSMAGCVGDDGFADRLCAKLEDADVEHSQVRRVPGENSGMSVAIVDDNGDYGAVIVSAANLAVAADEISLPPMTAVTLLQNEIPEAANIAIARRAHEASSLVILNAAPARALSRSLLDAVNLLVVNRVEARSMARASTADDGLALALLEATPCPAVLVTLGGQGAWYAERGVAPFFQPALDVQAMSTHGAGDAFVGALAARLALGQDIKPSLQYASIAAALHVSSPAPARTRLGPGDVAVHL